MFLVEEGQHQVFRFELYGNLIFLLFSDQMQSKWRLLYPQNFNFFYVWSRILSPTEYSINSQFKKN